jgi:hypothetical protein
LLRRALLSALVALTLAPTARAADPIMPLSQVQAGMDCTALSVVRGTTISQFDVEVLDVIGTQAGLSGPRILVRVSGPAVDDTGIGPGFSGSPIYCPGPGGVSQNAGAISESVGEYGNHVVLVTPIEEMLRDPPATPAASARARRGIARSARPLAGLLTVSGLSGNTRDLFARAGLRAKRPVLAAPAGPLGGFPPQNLVPGSAVAATIASGDIAAGAVGTVTYRDGARLWAFGHSFDTLGRRALMLEDAYVFGVISNPFTLPEIGAGTYKLTSAGGHVQGTVTSDSVASIAGTVGQTPPTIPLIVTAREQGSDRVVRLDSALADERTLGFGAGLSLVAPIGASQALEQLFRNFGPATLKVCLRVHVAGRRRPLGYCNPYFDPFTPLDDLLQAGSLVDAFDLPAPKIEGVAVSIRARRGVKSDVLVRARAPRRVVAGKRIRLRVTVQRRNGGRRVLRVPMRVPRGLRRGNHALTLIGTGGSLGSAEDAFLIEFVEVFSSFFGGPVEPRTLRELDGRIAGLHEDVGIAARIRRGGERLVYRSDDVSFEGRLRLTLKVRRARR